MTLEREKHAFERKVLFLDDLLREHLHGVTSMQLDYVLWNRGRQPAYKAQPRHRARSVFY